jgi:hypothetical protein
VHAIAQPFTQILGAPRVQRSKQLRQMLRVEDDVLKRQPSRDCAPRDRRRQFNFRRRHDDAPPFGPGPTCDADRAILPWATARHAAEERGGRVVRVSLDLRCRGQDLVRRTPAVDQFAQPEPGNRRGGTAPEAATQRNLAAHVKNQRRRPPPRRWQRLERRLDAIGTAERTISEPALQPPAAVSDHIRDSHPKIQRDRDSKRVEPWTKVGNRRRHDDLPPRANTRGYALHSPSMTSGLNA